MIPKSATFLWSGGGFGSGYDALHPGADIAIPSSAKRVEVWSIVTGHGSGTNQCSEFCNHQHQIVVGAKSYLREFKEAGSSNKCMPNMDDGMPPNQGGTWWFGRGGWCPGKQVDPWVIDATADAPAGSIVHLEYHGQFAGKAPPDGSGDIDFSSYLVVYE
jgi:hypothetical protein